MNTIEDTIFARKRWLEDKMLAFGFEKEGQEYCYECDFFDDDLRPACPYRPRAKSRERSLTRSTTKNTIPFAKKRLPAPMYRLSGMPMKRSSTASLPPAVRTSSLPPTKLTV